MANDLCLNTALPTRPAMRCVVACLWVLVSASSPGCIHWLDVDTDIETSVHETIPASAYFAGLELDANGIKHSCGFAFCKGTLSEMLLKDRPRLAAELGRKISKSFSSSLSRSRIFKAVGDGSQGADVRIQGRITGLVLRESFDGSILLMLIPVAPLYLSVLPFGVPYNCGSAGIMIDLEVTSVETGSSLAKFTVQAKGSACGSMYGAREPLDDALAKIFEEIIKRIQSNAGAIASAAERSSTGDAALARARARNQSAVVVVYDIHDESGGLQLGALDQLTELLSARIAQWVGYRVVPREKVRKALLEAKVDSYQQCYEETCQLPLGRALAAQYAVSTRIIHAGSECVFHSTLFDLSSEVSEKAATVRSVCDLDALMAAVDSLVLQFAGPAARPGKDVSAGNADAARAIDRPVAVAFRIQDSSGAFPQELLDELTDYLSSVVVQRGKYRMIPKKELKKQLLGTKIKSYESCYEEACQLEIGRELAAQKAILATLVKMETNCAIVLRVLDLTSRAVENTVTARTRCEDTGLMSAIDEAVDGL